MLLSAALIVRDEAAHLEACLASIDGLVDEVVVVDTGSTDGTAALARSLGATVDEIEWRHDFAAARNRSLDLAGGDWILYVDADERVRPGDHGGVRRWLAAAERCAAARVRFVPRVGWTPYREFRLWRHQWALHGLRCCRGRRDFSIHPNRLRRRRFCRTIRRPSSSGAAYAIA